MDIVNDHTLARLGEGPCWHDDRQNWLWVDILNDLVFELPFEHLSQMPRAFRVPGHPSAVFPLDEDYAMVLTRLGLVKLHLSSGATELETPFDFPETHRTNDGTVGPDGRLWFGTMEFEPTGLNGAIYTFHQSEGLIERCAGIGIPNLFVFSRDAKQLFVADSYRNQIFTINVNSSSIDSVLTVSHFEESAGTPDGGEMDSNDRLWNARWRGQAVIAYSGATGAVTESIKVPFLQPTSCCFGGPEKDHLFVTSAYDNMGDDELSRFPQSGAVFIRKLNGIKGIKTEKMVGEEWC